MCEYMVCERAENGGHTSQEIPSTPSVKPRRMDITLSRKMGFRRREGVEKKKRMTVIGTSIAVHMHPMTRNVNEGLMIPM